MGQITDLRELSAWALAQTLRGAPGYEAVQVPGGGMALSGEATADLNLAFLPADANADAFLDRAVTRARQRGLPLLIVGMPGIAPAEAAALTRRGLRRSETDLPLMALDLPALATGVRAVAGLEGRLEIRSAQGPVDIAAVGDLISLAFDLPRQTVRQALEPSLLAGEPIRAFIAWRDGVAVSSVSITVLGETAGIWSMATPPDLQGRGFGRALLSHVLQALAADGIRRVFLHASPAGRRLYEDLGFTLLAEQPVWSLAAAPPPA